MERSIVGFWKSSVSSFASVDFYFYHTDQAGGSSEMESEVQL
jgi:hypothetical protein